MPPRVLASGPKPCGGKKQGSAVLITIRCEKTGCEKKANRVLFLSQLFRTIRCEKTRCEKKANK